jgi:archaellum biogenesis protein FlaJ (TadC family)
MALYTKGKQLEGLNAGHARRDVLIDEIMVLGEKFATEYERLIEVFKRYLKLGTI